MRPLLAEEIASREHYAGVRERYRNAVIAHKRTRRMAIGDRVTLVFEDRETLRFQVQEMLWIEHITDPEKIQYELDVYNELMPGAGELSATLFVEITDPSQIRAELDRLVGIDEHVALTLGGGAEQEVIRASFDPKQMEEDRLSAVQYIRFAFSRDQVQRFVDPETTARIRIDHPGYVRHEEIPARVRDGLIGDLLREPECLLAPEAAAREPAADEEVLFVTERARVLRPARPRAPGHAVVEPLEPVASLLEADAQLLASLLAVVQRVAREVVRDYGACRIHIDVGDVGDVGAGDGGGDRLRWHVYAPLP